MPTAIVTTNGRITVPKELRDDLGLEPGSQLMFVKVRGDFYRIVRRTGELSDLVGMLYDPARPPMSIEEINNAIAEGGAESGMRGYI